MAIHLPPLPFTSDALEPHMSARTLEFHHEKHHQAYVDQTNYLIAESELDRLPLEEIVQRAHAEGNYKLFNQAGQAWNHEFLWQSLSAEPSAPNDRLRGLLDNSFGDISGFTQAFKEEAVGHFGSGWAWLCEKGDGLIILTTHDADTPLVQQGVKPLITLDLWEHAYYLDYQNARPNFVDAFLGHLINWDFAALNLVGRPHNLEVENEMLRPPERNGEPPRSATEPPRQRGKGQPAKERRRGITKREDGK